MDKLTQLLEEHREKLGMSGKDFGFHLRLSGNRTNAGVYYGRIRSGRENLTRETISLIAKALGVEESVVKALNDDRKKTGSMEELIGVAEMELSGEQLRYLARIADGMPRRLPLHFLVKHLNFMEQSSQ